MDLNSIMNLGIKKVLDRGTAIILEENETSIFVKDMVSNVYLLGTNDVGLGIQWLKQHEDEEYELIQVFDERLADYLLEEYGYKQGYIPFCQVEINNQDSMNLQKKLGFTISNESLYWVY